MKKSEIRKIIKEEISKHLLTEKFQSSRLSGLYSLLSGQWRGGKQLFDRMAQKRKFDWANTPDKAVKKASEGNSAHGIINIFVVTTPKKNVRDRSGWAGTVNKGLLGMTDGKTVLAINGGIASKRGDRAGADYNTKGIHNFKAFNEYADVVYQIDTSMIPSSADLTKSREEARRGAEALKSARDVLNDNRRRYQNALTMKAGEGGWKSARDMVKRATEALEKAITNHTAMLSKGFYASGWNSQYSVASRLYEQVMSKFQRFQEQNKSALKNPDDKYHKDRMAGTLKDMQDEFKEFMRKMQQIQSEKPKEIQAGW